MDVSILVVDDDDNVQRFLSELLEEEGFHVVCEKDGDWALRALQRRSFDAAILDVVLPGKSGFELAEAIRAQPHGQELPLIFLSGIYRGALHREESIARHGAIAYLDKPLSTDELLSALRHQLGDRYPQSPSSRSQIRRVLDAAPAEQLADRASRQEKKEVEHAARLDFGGGNITRGDLDRTPFAEVLAQLYRWKSSGALLLKQGKIKKIIYLKDGYPTYIKSNVLAECLGKVMVRERLITALECEESLKVMKAKKRQQGTVLIEMGCISPHNLVYALELQLEAKLYDIFSWTEGDYQFNPKAAAPSEIIELDRTPASIIFEGVRRSHDEGRLRKLLEAHLDSFLAVHPDPLQRFQEMDLSSAERKLVAMIDGKKTLQQILDKQVLPLERGMALCYSLIAAQMVQPQARKVPQKERLAPPPLPPAKVPPPPPPKRRGVKKKASASAPPPPPPEREELARRAKEMRGMTYFEMLGVARTASSDEIKRAYFALTREFHPDKHFAKASADVRALADQIFSMIRTAYQVLSDPADREAYEGDLLTGIKKGAIDEVSRILAAEGKFQRGESLLRKRDYARAADLFRESIELYADEGEFHSTLGWAVFQADPNNAAVQRQAEDHILRGIELNPKVDSSYVFLGSIYKATGRAREAEEQFEKAIQCNPDNTEALRELRLIGQSRERGNKRGLLTDPT